MSNDRMLQNLADEVDRLKRENEFLKNKLKEFDHFSIENIRTIRTAEEKIRLFRSYFRGREDVYATRFISKKTGKKGYSFVCKNRFDAQCCQITLKTGSCHGCSFHCPVPLTDEIVRRHFSKPNNDHSVAIYPLLSDNTCYFLAFDFDDDYWFESMLSLYHMCLSKKIRPLMERSQSGEGGHLWIFFKEKISALKARNLGMYLLDETMKSNPHIRFNSYDRMFPSQDMLLSEDSIGNCIALPLQYDAYKKGNSAFIDESGVACDHPIDVLAEIPKLTEEAVDLILQEYEGIENCFVENDQLRIELGQTSSYSQGFEAFCDSRIHINKMKLNALTLRELRRIGSMPNPEYYQKERLHQFISSEDTPRILSEVEETDREIILPRGTYSRFAMEFAGSNIKFKTKFSAGEPIDLTFKGQLRLDQQEAVHCAHKENLGIIQSPTGSGKTVIALYIVAEQKVSTLVIVPKLELIDGWRRQAEEFLTIPPSSKKRDAYIGELSSRRRKLKFHLDIAMIHSLANRDDLEDVFSHYGMVIIDECHHVASEMFRKVLRRCACKYIYSFSATPKRQDHLDRIMYMYCGRLLYSASQNLRLSLLNFDKILVKQATTFRPDPAARTYSEIIGQMIVSERRNFQIFKDISRAVKENRHILVLSERVHHLEILYEMIQRVEDNCFMVRGDMKQKERNEVFAKLQMLKESYVLLSTGSLIGEGFDLPSLDTLFLTVPIRWEGRLNQYIGRIHRSSTGKSNVKVYDYVDLNNPMFQSMFKARLKEYYANNYHIQEETETAVIENQVFSSNTCLPILKADLAKARSSIYISTNYISLEKYKQLMNSFDQAQQRGTVIQLETSSKQKNLDEVSKYIKGIGIVLHSTEGSKQVLIIDRRIVWCGTSGVLSVQKEDDYQIRLENEALATEIYEK